MSYYTAPYDFGSLRHFACQWQRAETPCVTPGLRQLAEQDLQMIFANKPELRPVVLAAYATASTEGKRLIESIIQQTDPSFLMRLQKGAP